MSRRPTKKPPSLLRLPFESEVTAAFTDELPGVLIALEYERIETLAYGVCRMLSAFVNKPGGSLTVMHIFPDAEVERGVLIDIAAMMARQASQRLEKIRDETGRQKQA